MVAHQLTAGHGVVIIDRTGRATEAALNGAQEAGDRAAVRLFTDVGELLLAERAVVTTRKGRLFARDVARQVVQGAQARIELARAGTLPPGQAPDERSSYRAALAHLNPPVIRIPRRLGQEQAVARILDVAGVPFADVSDDRWTAIAFDDAGLTAETVAPSVNDVALLVLTAWATDGSTIVSRTTLEQFALRRRLLAALVCANRPAEVRWTPAYKPVEARVRPGQPRSYATTKAAVFEPLPMMEIRVTDPGSIISDLAIVTAQRGT